MFLSLGAEWAERFRHVTGLTRLKKANVNLHISLLPSKKMTPHGAQILRNAWEVLIKNKFYRIWLQMQVKVYRTYKKDSSNLK